ncbi:T0189692 isoform 3 [Pongo abelii]|uniref:T0189692 isoform 3 n=1 Tax=Pongo abelii TaxID=9601 RepID=A0A2J8R650_PONAB|nr:T0189692 isoform 3 [Pongo abelii]
MPASWTSPQKSSALAPDDHGSSYEFWVSLGSPWARSSSRLQPISSEQLCLSSQMTAKLQTP